MYGQTGRRRDVQSVKSLCTPKNYQFYSTLCYMPILEYRLYRLHLDYGGVLLG